MSRPLFASRARVAEMLDIAPSTVDQYVRDGILPRPIYLTAGCARLDQLDAIPAVRRAGKLTLALPLHRALPVALDEGFYSAFVRAVELA